MGDQRIRPLRTFARPCTDPVARCPFVSMMKYIRKLEGELGLMLEYFEKGIPYWYGTSPADRIRNILKGED